jgi:hypothetical protein
MAKKRIAVVAYDLNPGDPLTADAVVFLDTLNKAGYAADLVPQSWLNETDQATFKHATAWMDFDGIVICGFYSFWNLRELILSQRPVICANIGYVDDLGLGEDQQEHVNEHLFNVVASHSIITGAGLAPGGLDIGNGVWLDSTLTIDHRVDVLITTQANKAVLIAHQTHKLVYFGWYRMSQASPGSPLFKLIVQAAKWAF